jgi:large subunit ribosomal protein L13Ae
MMPYKTTRGAACLDRLKVFEGIPSPYDVQKRVVVPQAIKVLRLKSYRKFCMLGDLSSKVGWKYHDLIKRLEADRKERYMKNYLPHKEAMDKIRDDIIAQHGSE